MLIYLVVCLGLLWAFFAVMIFIFGLFCIFCEYAEGKKGDLEWELLKLMVMSVFWFVWTPVIWWKARSHKQ